MTTVWVVGPATVNDCPRLTYLGLVVITALLGIGRSELRCSSPPSVTNANVTVDANLTRATYTCREGYLPDSGDPTATCTAGNWTLPGLTCSPGCSSPPYVANANVTVDANLTRATYTCGEGYLPDSGDPTATCTAGNWTLPGLTCSLGCSSPPSVANANVTVDANLTRATYTCREGYLPDSGDPTATCTAGNWTLPGLTCSPGCPPPPSVPNATVTVNLTRATYTCREGQLPDTSDPTATCAGGSWTPPTFKCKAIVCGAPPNISQATQWGSDSTDYGSKRYYQCYSGHVLATAWGGATNFTYVCSASNGQPAWVAAFGYAASSCRRTKDYEGCYPGNGQMTEAGTKGINSCKQRCFSLSHGYAALRGSKCACVGAISSEAVDDVQCSLPCELSADKLCGGPDDRWSVYTTFHGCFKNLSDDGTFTALNELTCREKCRGRDKKYAAYASSTLTCACYSTIPQTAQPYNSCGKDADNTTFTADVALLAKTQVPNVSSCEELFKAGVYLHGHYYLTGHTGPSLCNFYDNSTTCELRWFGFNGSCYYFGSKVFPNFNEAFTHCLEKDSLVVVINSAEEKNFIQLVYNTAESYLGSLKNPYLGLFDAYNVLAPQWIDGSLMTYSNYASLEPDSFGYKCVLAVSSNPKQQWVDQKCSNPQRAICERSAGVYGCIDHQPTGYTPVYTFNETQRMTLALCMETCRARRVMYASVSGAQCQCLTSLPEHRRVPWRECRKKLCTGSAYQLCGDPALSVNGTVKSFVMKDAGRPYAGSCRELEVQGVTGSNLTILRQGVPVNVICGNESEVSCPFSFARMNGRCYKYLPTKSTKPLFQCSSMNAYPAVLNSAEEEATVFGDPSILGDHTYWMVGLYYYPGVDGLFRTGSGESPRGMRLPYNPLHKPITCVVYNKLTKALTGGSCNVPFVCEKGPEFLGCGVKPSDSAMVLYDYREISALQCVELCRGRSLRYASIVRFPLRCFCTATSPNIKYAPGTCNYPCHGAVGFCGSRMHTYIGSVYDVDYFTPFANNCSDLYEEDVLVPGTYMIAGQPTFCYMKDNSTCSLPARYWEGVGVKGACFKWSILNYPGGINAAAHCRALSPAHFLTSIRSTEERLFLRTLYRRMKSTYSNKNVHIGGVDEFHLGAFTWADGWLMTSYAWYGTYPWLNYGAKFHGQFMTLNTKGFLTNYKLDSYKLRVICREAPEAVGCFLHTSSLSPVIANYSSMSVVLCKQTCLALNQSLALLDIGSCYCTPNASAALVGPLQNGTGCDVPCPGSRLQSCASGGFLRGYLVDWNDMAERCDSLHANFVLLYNTYLLRDNSTGDVTPTACGLSDNSTCPPGFLGYKSHCFRFFPWTHKNMEAAARYCRSINSHLATPHDHDEITFLVTAIKGIPSLSKFVRWRLGVRFLTRYQLAVGSGGALLTSDLWNMTALPGNEDGATLTIQPSHLERTNKWTEALPFICQVKPAFQGCRKFSSSFSASATFNLSQSSRTVQQCVTLCHGNDTRYALLTSTQCFCVTSDVIALSDVASCPSDGCDDYSLQACGDDVTGVYALYDVEAYNETEKEARSCDQYRQMNVTANGQYYINSPTMDKLRVTCGTLGAGHEDILTQEANNAQYLASSSHVGATPVDARLQMQRIVWKSWRPLSSNTQPWIQVTLTHIYAVKAVALRGNVTKLTLSFGMSADDLTVYSSALAGPSHVSEMAVRYLSLPLVATVVRLQPTSWSVTAALAFTLLGQRYSAFNHSDPYIGCFADPASSLISVTSASSLEHCRAACGNQSYPFFGLRHISEQACCAGGAQCGCSHSLGQYGELEDSYCNTTCVTSRCGSDVTKSVAMYRAYELKCTPQNDVINASSTVTPLVTRAEEVTEVGSRVRWECVEGRELAGVGYNMTVTCLPNATWSATPPPACTLVECGSPPNVSNAQVTYSNVTYGSEAVYQCEGQLETAEGLGFGRTSCNHSKDWSPAPPVCANPKAVRLKKWLLYKQGYRLTGSLTSLKTRSRVDCAITCVSNNLCTAYSFRHNAAPSAGADNCLQHVDYLSRPASVLDSDWNVYKVKTVM